MKVLASFPTTSLITSEPLLSPETALQLQAWLDACHVRLTSPPHPSRRPLRLGEHIIGSVHPELWPRVAAHFPVRGKDSEALARLANDLRASGDAGVWRNELVAVRSPAGLELAAIERGVVRVLGIRTEAVHLVGLAPDGRVWLQQRAFNKANDPGLWDTLVGGLVAQGEMRGQALERETWEEAGLVLSDLLPVQAEGVVEISKPGSPTDPLAHTLETLHWQVVIVPQGMEPVNQDGEVARFEAVTPDDFAQRIVADTCTDEAAWLMALALGWRS